MRMNVPATDCRWPNEMKDDWRCSTPVKLTSWNGGLENGLSKESWNAWKRVMNSDLLRRWLVYGSIEDLDGSLPVEEEDVAMDASISRHPEK